MPDNINSDREAGACIYAAFGGRVMLPTKVLKRKIADKIYFMP
jgi:hypothetical protein